MRFSSKFYQILAILRGWDYEAEICSLQLVLRKSEEGHSQTVEAYKDLDGQLAATQVSLVETEDYVEVLKATIEALRNPTAEVENLPKLPEAADTDGKMSPVEWAELVVRHGATTLRERAEAVQKDTDAREGWVGDRKSEKAA